MKPLHTFRAKTDCHMLAVWPLTRTLERWHSVVHRFLSAIETGGSVLRNIQRAQYTVYYIVGTIVYTGYYPVGNSTECVVRYRSYVNHANSTEGKALSTNWLGPIWRFFVPTICLPNGFVKLDKFNCFFLIRNLSILKFEILYWCAHLKAKRAYSVCAHLWPETSEEDGCDSQFVDLVNSHINAENWNICHAFQALTRRLDALQALQNSECPL